MSGERGVKKRAAFVENAAGEGTAGRLLQFLEIDDFARVARLHLARVPKL
jgi:hypothetical protein